MRRACVFALVSTWATLVSAEMPGSIQTEMIACKGRDMMVRALELIDQKDYRAADELWSRGQAAGVCRVFDQGDKVIVESREMLSGLSKMHAVGEPTAYWIVNHAVDPKR